MEYSDIRDRLTPEARELFIQMVEAHQASTGDRSFIRTWGLGGTNLMLTGGRGDWGHVDEGTLVDLVRYGLLHEEPFGDRRSLRVTGDSLHFYRWLMNEEGLPVEQPSLAAVRLIDGGAYSQRHPGSSQHLGEALDLLRSDRADDPTISGIGGHLRNAVFDLVSDLAGNDGGKQEKPLPRLSKLIEASKLSEREKRVMESLFELTTHVLSLDQRLTHVRDEKDKGAALRGWDEARRAVYATAFLCAELDMALSGAAQS